MENESHNGERRIEMNEAEKGAVRALLNILPPEFVEKATDEQQITINNFVCDSIAICRENNMSMAVQSHSADGIVILTAMLMPTQVAMEQMRKKGVELPEELAGARTVHNGHDPIKRMLDQVAELRNQRLRDAAKQN